MNVSWVSNAPKSGKLGNNGRFWKKIPLQRQHIGINWPHTYLTRPYQQQKNLQLSRLLSWKTQHVTLPILISAGGHFQQLDLFQKWNCICGSRFSNFLPILISAGGHFHILDLFTKWNCICRNSFFQFVTRAILILSRKQLRLHHTCGPAATDAKSLCSLRHHRIWFIALSFTSNQPRQLKFSVHVPVNHSTNFYILWKCVRWGRRRGKETSICSARLEPRS